MPPATSRSSHSRRSLSLVSLLPLSRRSPLPRSATALPPAAPLLSSSRCFSRLSAQLCPPRGIFWPLESIELSSRKDDSSDAHSDTRKEKADPKTRTQHRKERKKTGMQGRDGRTARRHHTGILKRDGRILGAKQKNIYRCTCVSAINK